MRVRLRAIIGASITVCMGTGIMLIWVLSAASRGVFRDEIDLIAQALNSPLVLIFPLVAVLPVFHLSLAPLTDRFVSQLWFRVSIRKALSWHLCRVTTVAAATWLLSVVLISQLCILLVPMLFPDVFDPAGYGLDGMSDIERKQEIRERFNFGVLGSWGPHWFGLLYGSWLALHAASYAALAAGCAIRMSLPVLGMLVPFGVFTLQTLASALFGMPQVGLMYLLIPGGLVRSGEAIPAFVTILLIAAALAVWIPILRSPSRFANLT